MIRRWPAEGGGDRSVWLSTGAGFLALERADPARSRRVPSRTPRPGGTSWRSGSPGPTGEAWEARLAAAGVRLARRSPFSLFFRDPEGNRVALSHWPEEA